MSSRLSSSSSSSCFITPCRQQHGTYQTQYTTTNTPFKTQLKTRIRRKQTKTHKKTHACSIQFSMKIKFRFLPILKIRFKITSVSSVPVAIIEIFLCWCHSGPWSRHHVSMGRGTLVSTLYTGYGRYRST